MIANYHTHTPRCGHARGSEREYIEQAIAHGFSELGFSDHAPMPFPKSVPADNLCHLLSMRVQMEQTEEYVNTLLDLRREYKNDIDIHIGFETEHFDCCFDEFIEYISQYPIDYLILGQHFSDPMSDSMMYVGNRKNAPELLSSYVDTAIKAISSGKITYVAHPDLPAVCHDLALYQSEMTRLIECANSHHVPLEINFLGLRELRNYPSIQFWQLAAGIGCDVIFGSDAHRPEDVYDPVTHALAKSIVDSNPGLHLLERAVLRPIV